MLAVVGLWLAILWSGPEYRQIPSDFRVGEFQAQEPTNDELEALRASIEKAARQRSTAKIIENKQIDAGSVGSSQYDNELLRRAETGESIPSDGSFDPADALDRLKSGESREEVLGKAPADE